jgi:hypothetical protein
MQEGCIIHAKSYADAYAYATGTDTDTDVYFFFPFFTATKI